MSGVEHLGHWITHEGIKTMIDKVDSTLSVQRPRTRKERRCLVGMIVFTTACGNADLTY